MNADQGSPAPGANAPVAALGEDPLLLLASASAGRRATLAAARIEHALLPVDLDERRALADARVQAASIGQELAPADQVLLLARAKAEAATAVSAGGYVVLGCDSMLELDGEVRGKPMTPNSTMAQWRSMRGRTAVLHSGHWIVDDREEAEDGTGATFGATTSCEVTFAEVTDEEIDAYIETGEPLGVAGGFTIDGIGGPFIERVDGDPHAVVGLSLPLLRSLLGEIGIGVHELWAEQPPGEV